MAVLFVSHSSKDDAYANALEAWLRTNNFTDIFVDHESINGGDNWRNALTASANSCRVIISLVSENWLASADCFAEFMAGSYMGKRLIPLFILPSPAALAGEARNRLDRVQSADQGIDLMPCIGSDGLDIERNKTVAGRLKLGLRAAGAMSRVGLDPEAFAIDRNVRETPFPGLASFGDDDADAALFYGRNREIAHTLEELRSMRVIRDQRPLVILGASGAGKSSLLKAGVIPRLRREAPAWLPLRAFRPGGDPLLNFSEALSRTLADYGKREAHGVIRDRLLQIWSDAGRDSGGLSPAGLGQVEAALNAEGRALRAAAGRPDASILISVDQAEELARAESKSSEALADYLRSALASKQSLWQLAFTIRTDSFPELQRHRRFQDLEARGYDLRAIPVFRFDSVVEEPAKRYGVNVDNLLVDALMESAPKEDALPLLAFGLQRLWQQYSASGSLTKLNYDNVGGLAGLIEDAAERAMLGMEPGQDVPLPSGVPPKRRTDLAASTFVPALAGINDDGATIRHAANWSTFTEDQQDLLKRFERWRLVVRKGDEDGGLVEVTHEALFRTWKRLASWLEPERARLDALRALLADAATWERNGRNANFLNHREGRLAEVEALEHDTRYAKRVTSVERDYIEACAKAEALTNDREQRSQNTKHRMRTAVGALMMGVIVALLGIIYKEPLAEWRYQLGTVGPYIAANFTPHVKTLEQEATLKRGDTFRECSTQCPEMVVLPPGEFWMGPPDNDKDFVNKEGPRQKITISKRFAVATNTVTWSEWEICVTMHGCSDAGTTDSSFGKLRRPVVNVTWFQAKTYVTWLARATGRDYRLLSEAEWEYAARGVTRLDAPHPAYWWGDDIGKGNANCSGCGSRWDGKRTAPVASFKQNPFGLFDMGGNVWQWVEDCTASYSGEPRNEAPHTTPTCKRHIVRGGAWYSTPDALQTYHRYRLTPDERGNNLGFRVARALPP